MTVTIHPSVKFLHSSEQYYAVAAGHTLLRLTYGSLRGKPGGSIKTATANDYGAERVYPDRHKLTAALRCAVQELGGRANDVTIELDQKRRLFGEISGQGTREELTEALRRLAEQVEHVLSRSYDNLCDCGYVDMREVYQELCVLEGDPVYLSDGVYLNRDGRTFQ